MDVSVLELLLNVRGDRLGLGDLLGHQALAFQHVLEVHVATNIELVGVINGDAAFLEQAGQHPVGDGGADLRLDVVANDRQSCVGEFLRPLRIRCDEHRKAVDECASGVDGALGIKFVRFLRTDR